MSESSEPVSCKVLRRYLPRLARTLDPAVVATELHSADVIDDRTWEEARKSSQGANYDRCLNVLEALIRSVRAKPECFDNFCSILEDHPTTESLSAQLKEELKKEKADKQTTTANGESIDLCDQVLRSSTPCIRLLKSICTCTQEVRTKVQREKVDPRQN